MPTKTVTKGAKRTAKRPSSKIVKTKVVGVTPFLWFDKDAEKAARFYVSLLEGSKVVSATPMSVEFTLAGQDFYALNGGPTYELTPAFSFFVVVKTQAEVDRLWDALTADGGKESRCGWLVDRFGVSWQIIPQRLTQLLSHKEAKVQRASFAAMMTMGKIDIAALDAAAKKARA
ncbi:MAG TPA: VOC family protein [Candidatus Thermoplasmatota archaeon]|nr:VOC family protein [Candidatus Thermoplasmatota archaeon]